MKYVGKGYSIHDAESKVRGITTYAGDLRLSRMVHMALVTSTLPHAIVKEIDCSAALEMPGVVTVLHCFNTTEKKFSRYKRTRDIEVPEQERVFTDHPMFVGDRIAAVIAEDPATAHLAVNRIKVTYEELPAAETPIDTLNGVIDGMHPEGVVYEWVFDVGMSPAENETDLVQETTFRNDRVTHVAMENHVSVASYDEGLNELTIWSPNQSVYGMRYVVANYLEIPFNKIRMIKSTMGGSFGGKQECILEPVVGYVSWLLKRPVSLSLTREGSMTSAVCRAPLESKTRTVFSRDGKLKSVSMDTILDSGAYVGSSHGYVRTLGEMAVRNYSYSYLHYRGRAVTTNMPVSGGFRGWSSPECALILEYAMDQAAKKLDMDPIELRLKNVITEGDIDPFIHATFDKTRISECLTTGRERFNWYERRKRCVELSDDRYKIGVGMACGGHINGNYPDGADFSIVNMRVDEDGAVNVNVTLHDHGCGTVRVMQVIAGEVLGIDPEKISIREGDTYQTPEDVGCYASRSTHVIGAAVVKCGEALISAILNQAARCMGVPEDSLKYDSGEVYVKSDPGKRMTLKEIAIAAHYRFQESLDVKIQYRSPANPGVHGAHFARVRVDTWTGLVTVQEYLAVHDIGRAINPSMIVGQVQGAVQMGCGIALTETMTPKNPGTGRTVNSLRDYHVLNAFESPKVEVVLIEDPSNYGPFGAKGIGEVCFVPVSATIVSAVNNALGTDFNFIPMTPDKILDHLKVRRQ